MTCAAACTLDHRFHGWGLFVHILISGLYACIVYLALLAYVVIVGAPLLKFLVWSPFIISAAIVAITALDLVVRGVQWGYRRWHPAVKTD